MKNHNSAFNPNLKPYFSKALIIKAQSQAWNTGELFYRLQQGNHFPGALAVAHHWLSLRLARTEIDPHVSLEQVTNHCDYVPELNTLKKAFNEQKTDCLQQIAPVISTTPLWLQSISNSATCDHPLAVRLLTLYKTLAGTKSDNHLFQSLLEQHGFELSEANRPVMVDQLDIEPTCLEFASQNLSLARLPRVFFPELLGYTLAYCQNPILQNRSEEHLSAIVQILNEYVQDYPEQSAIISKRLLNGFYLYRNTLVSVSKQLSAAALRQDNVTLKLHKTFNAKAFAAKGHHHNIKLAGKGLDQWFQQSPFPTEAFIEALQESPYVDTENLDNSLLLKLFSFDGPMFGVLSGTELKTLKTALQQKKHSLEVIESSKFSSIPTKTLEGKTAIPFDKLKNHELYYYLINADLYPEVVRAAHHKVKKVLFWTRLCHRIPFKHFQKQAFEAYFKALYNKEMEAYQPLNGKPKFNKATYRWGIEQMAPAILADGCWLQGLQNSLLRHRQDITTPLLKTYYDEIGNGIRKQNHPLIYQQLLQQQHINLPAIDKPDFIKHPGFIREAFDLPVYLLSIGLLPETFLPELLGLNLAIELSGLGKQYMQLSDALRFWGIDSKIIDIHISIDNLASGHSALAIRAIHNYLFDIASLQGSDSVDQHWKRIYTGYCSLKQAGFLFAAAMIKHHLMGKFLSKKYSK